MKKGFTLVEVLATIVIISIISLLGSVGINAAKKAINQSMWNTNVELIESAASSFGNDKKTYIANQTTSCKVNNITKKPCLTITVQTLLNRGYLNTKDTINYNKIKKYKVVINKTVDKTTDETTNFKNGYYVNKYKIAIYIENGIVYAKYLNTT